MVITNTDVLLSKNAMFSQQNNQGSKIVRKFKIIDSLCNLNTSRKQMRTIPVENKGGQKCNSSPVNQREIMFCLCWLLVR
jgi:hypothetical protein